MRVLFMPVPRHGNPHLKLLADGLAGQAVQVRTARNYASPLPFVSAVIRGPRPDVFHLHWTQPYLHWPRSDRISRVLVWRLLVQLWLIRRLGIRIVWTVHNLTAHEKRDKPQELVVSRKIAARADVLIVHCNAARELVIKALELAPPQADRLVVIPRGNYLDSYSTQMSRADARNSFGFTEDEKVFVLFGSLRAYKGAAEVLGAFHTIADVRARLLIAGDPFTGALRDEIAGTAASDPRVVTRLEFIPDNEVQRYMRAADCAVLPYRDILNSGSAYLAMSFALPVIAPRLGCLPEAVPDGGGILYDPSDEHGLQGALVSALAADLGAMGQVSLERMKTLSWDNVAALTIERAYGGRVAGVRQ